MNFWRRLRNRLLPGGPPPGPRFVIHRHYQMDAPFPQYDARRPFRILAYLEARGLLHPGMLRRPRPMSLKRLRLVHDPAYLRSLEEPGALEPVLGFPVDSATQDRFLCFQRRMCGGTLRAAHNALRRGGVAVNLGGGLHHAARASGSGFCVFNDVAVAVASLRQGGFAEPILIVDLDLHDGDGTRALFADDPGVHTFSLHNRTLGEAEAVASTCRELGGEVDDATYLNALLETLPPVVEAFRPGLVFYLAGSDPGIDDALGDWRISLEGILERDRLVMGLFGGGDPGTGRNPAWYQPRIPVVILLAGGYGRRAWRHGAAFFSWLLSGDADLDIPLELELPVDHYRRLTRLMRHPGLQPDERSDGPAGRLDPADDADWGLSDEDFDPGRPQRDTLFLGVFSRHGIELAMEEYGLMDRLRRLGFRDLQLTMDLDDPLGHTLRIQTGGRQCLVLLEVRLRIDRSSDPGRSYLMVEWLLIQDARSRFRMDRDLLPGQDYPGLGLLRDTAAALVVLCERLGLDGLTFTPSHYHLASLSRPLAVCPDAAQEGRFRALQQAVRGLRLREASRTVERGLIADAKTGRPVIWEPARLVIPVSEALKEELGADAFRRVVQQVAEGCDYRLGNRP